jgi:hypothetical protein
MVSLFNDRGLVSSPILSRSSCLQRFKIYNFVKIFHFVKLILLKLSQINNYDPNLDEGKVIL